MVISTVMIYVRPKCPPKLADGLSIREEEFLEKSFYLDEFHEKTLLLAIAPGYGRRSAARRPHRHGPRADPRGGTPGPGGRRRRDGAAARGAVSPPCGGEPVGAAVCGCQRGSTTDDRRRVAVHPSPTSASLMRLWSLLRGGPIAVVWVPDAAWMALAGYAVKLAARLKVHKLVLMDPEGGVGVGRRDVVPRRERARHACSGRDEAEWIGLGHRRSLIQVIREGLLAGIPSINLCTLGGLARELYTYEGSGTLFTLEDYCRVERLGIDDFREVERLLERGQREGFLKIRSREEIGEILFTGFGATIASGHLAGVGSLLCDRYQADRMAEIVALYTVSRFKGEGVGAKLLARILDEARSRQLQACLPARPKNARRSSSLATDFAPSRRPRSPPRSGSTTIPSGCDGSSCLRLEL